MNIHLAAGLALLICLAGIPLIRRDLVTGHSQLWLGGKPLDVTRHADPLLFWVATGGKALLVAGLIVVSLMLLLSR